MHTLTHTHTHWHTHWPLLWGRQWHSLPSQQRWALTSESWGCRSGRSGPPSSHWEPPSLWRLKAHTQEADFRWSFPSTERWWRQQTEEEAQREKTTDEQVKGHSSLRDTLSWICMAAWCHARKRNTSVSCSQCNRKQERQFHILSSNYDVKHFVIQHYKLHNNVKL